MQRLLCVFYSLCLYFTLQFQYHKYTQTAERRVIDADNFNTTEKYPRSLGMQPPRCCLFSIFSLS